jgi:hypothetical protein
MRLLGCQLCVDSDRAVPSASLLPPSFFVGRVHGKVLSTREIFDARGRQRIRSFKRPTADPGATLRTSVGSIQDAAVRNLGVVRTRLTVGRHLISDGCHWQVCARRSSTRPKRSGREREKRDFNRARDGKGCKGAVSIAVVYRRGVWRAWIGVAGLRSPETGFDGQSVLPAGAPVLNCSSIST